MQRCMMLVLALSLSVVSGCSMSTKSGEREPAARASFVSTQGAPLGTVTLTDDGIGVRIRGKLQGLTPGTHGFHIHTTGKCEPSAFTTAGGHFNPTSKKHGFKNPEGHHAGDLPNVEAGMDGSATIDTLADGTSTALLDADGSALVIHAGRDDETTDPSGNSGARIACAVITS